MRIQLLEIENFRGIRSLKWKLPVDQKLIVLVGPGDSGKSTILDAIHYLLGDRWSIAFTDTDFYGADVSNPISIKAVVADIPAALRKENAFGLWLSGLDSDGVLHQDPEDQFTPALLVRLSVDESLEPQWTVERVDGESQKLTSSQRSHFSTFKVDDRNDTQLRWSRTSALGRLSSPEGADRHALAAASRAARVALASHESTSLAEVAKKVQERTNKIGGGRFTGIRPGLDTSRSATGAGLALYEDLVPLTSYGLGSRRLASFAVQQLASGSRSVAVVDEIESGLEPHRAVRLLKYLLGDDDYSQVVVTTHSPIVVEQARLENLATVQSEEGVVTITNLAGSDERLKRLRRSRPSSFLSRRVIVVEGATEYGMLLECVDAWDEERAGQGLSTSAGEGAALQDGQGGSEVPLRATAMSELGFKVAGFIDNDDRSVDSAVAEARAAGVKIIRWDPEYNTESQICAGLEANGLTSFLEVAVERRNAQDTVLQDLNSVGSGLPVSSLDVQEWLDNGASLEDARERVAAASVKRKWFKEVDGGKALGRWLMKNRAQRTLATAMAHLAEIHAFIYPDSSSVVASAEEKSVSSDG